MKKVTRRMCFIILILIIILICIYGISFAKYTANSLWNYFIESKGFYFSSDYLSTDNKTNVDNFWDGNKVEFNLKNYINNSSISSYDISYEVICTVDNANAKCVLNDTDKNSISGTLSSYEACNNKTDDGIDVSNYNKEACDTANYTWDTKSVDKSLYFSIISNDDVNLNDITVDIKVTSKEPYKKVIKGSFKLHKPDINMKGVDLSYNNYDNYDKLIISNSSEEDKCVNIAWDPTNLIIDSDGLKNYLTDKNGYVNSFIVNVPSKESLNYIFYNKQTNGQKGSVSDFSLMNSDGC